MRETPKGTRKAKAKEKARLQRRSEKATIDRQQSIDGTKERKKKERLRHFSPSSSPAPGRPRGTAPAGPAGPALRRTGGGGEGAPWFEREFLFSFLPLRLQNFCVSTSSSLSFFTFSLSNRAAPLLSLPRAASPRPAAPSRPPRAARTPPWPRPPLAPSSRCRRAFLPFPSRPPPPGRFS